MRSSLLIVIGVGLVAVFALVCIFLIANWPQLITVDADIPENFPESGFVHTDFESLLRKYVDPAGNVDFERWHRDRADRMSLDRYLAAVARYGPFVTPERFPKMSDKLAYWIYSYNAYVIKSVLDNWPINSVTDVKAPIEAVTGLGFFYRRRFYFGGTPMSLYEVENRIRSAYHDPRIHFVLWCASDSCPPLRPVLPAGDKLEELLELAAEDFVGDPKNVRIDHDQQRIMLSPIFKLYERDFIKELRRRGLSMDHGVVDYVASVAPASLAEELAASRDYEVVFADYDWSIRLRK